MSPDSQGLSTVKYPKVNSKYDKETSANNTDSFTAYVLENVIQAIICMWRFKDDLTCWGQN